MSSPEHPALGALKRCPFCGSSKVEARYGKALACLDCSRELFLNPAAATGVLLQGPDGRVVLLKRAKEPGKGKLGVPGGFVDAFESEEAAAIREVREETGLELEPGSLRYLCSSFNRYEYGGVSYASCDVYYHVRLASFDGLEALDETDAILLLRPEEVRPEDMAFKSGSDALAALLKQA